MAKMKGWYTFVECMVRYNPHWFGWRFLLRWLGKQLGGRRPGAQREVEEGMTMLMAATAPGAASTGTEAGPGVSVRAAEDMKRELKALRKAKGNELLMSPLLMHNLNLFNMRVQLLVGRPLWTQFSMLTSKKVTPAAHARWLSGEATGMGEQFLRQVWAGAVRNARELEQLGLSVTEDSRPIFVGPKIDLSPRSETQNLESTIPKHF